MIDHDHPSFNIVAYYRGLHPGLRRGLQPVDRPPDCRGLPVAVCWGGAAVGRV